MDKWQKLALAASTAVLSLGMVSKNPAQAVSFTFAFADRGQGSLSFKNTPLTGLRGFGEESISLDELYNLAEDVSFQFSYVSQIDYSGYNNYGESAGYNGETFRFRNGELIGINFLTSVLIGYGFASSLGEFWGFGDKFFLVKDDRFTEFYNINEFSVELQDYSDDDYYDEETDQYYSAFVRYYKDYKHTQTNQLQADGISYQESSLTREIAVYYLLHFGDSHSRVINKYPYSYSSFTPYDQLPQITFTTLDPISSSEPIPEPLTVLGTSTAIAFGLGFKKLKQKNYK